MRKIQTLTPVSYTNIVLRRIIGLKVKAETVKLLEENIDEYLHNLGVSKKILKQIKECNNY